MCCFGLLYGNSLVFQGVVYFIAAFRAEDKCKLKPDSCWNLIEFCRSQYPNDNVPD